MWAALALLLLVGAAVAVAVLCLCKGSSGSKDKASSERPRVAPIHPGFHWFEVGVEEGIEPEVLALPGDGDDVMGVAVIVGNPGVVHCFCMWARRMQEALAKEHGGRKAAFYVIGLKNFVTRVERHDAGTSMKGEAKFVAPAVQLLAARHKSSGLTLVAHSIGCWIALRHLLEAAKHGTGCLAGARVPLLLMAAPFLEFDWRGEQGIVRAVWSLPGMLWLAERLQQLFMMLPVEDQRKMLPALAGTTRPEDLEVALATQGCQRHHFPGLIFLALDEFRTMQPGTPDSGFVMLEALLQEPSRPDLVVLYCAKGDPYASLKHKERMSRLFAEHAGARAEVGCLGDVPHRFVQDDAHAQEASEAMGPALAAAWRQAASRALLPSA